MTLTVVILPCAVRSHRRALAGVIVSIRIVYGSP
jgi:hypothetical protein